MVVLGDKHNGGAEFDVMHEDATQTLNRIQVIGNLTRDPELRELPSGTLLVTFGIATNRTWVSSDGTRQEGVEYHNVICWNDRARFAANKLKKGMKIFSEGRLQNRSWETPEGAKQSRTEIVADMLVISTRMPAALREETFGGEAFSSHTAPTAGYSGSDGLDEDIFSTPSFVTGDPITPAVDTAKPQQDADDLPF
jgi:single-strand DNA-binding protein